MAWVKAYKGFNRDMTCRGLQFEEGKEYELPEGVEAKLCESGFHACEDPNDCFGYYEPGKSVFREVELDATDEKAEDSKRVGRRIRIGAALDVAKIVKAHFEYVNERCVPANGRVGGDGEAVSVGDKASASAGESGSASAGFRGSASAGESGSASAGFRGSAVSRGRSASGENGLSVARGNGVMVRGGLGAVLVIAEEAEDDYTIEAWKAAVVDGETIKPDTWYKLVNGEVVECEGDDDE